jgi:hypothetical protein
MKDFLDNEIKLGDRIVFAKDHGRNAGASLSHGQVADFTAKMVRIEYTDDNWSTPRKILKDPSKVIVL